MNARIALLGLVLAAFVAVWNGDQRNSQRIALSRYQQFQSQPETHRALVLAAIAKAHPSRYEFLEVPNAAVAGGDELATSPEIVSGRSTLHRNSDGKMFFVARLNRG
ncbi:MAG: hypothetical protein KDA96_03110 [Planctomycetaceae bacterium]|nr:hypothetical protein [Planctomycetaceae bacterium]